MVHGGIGADAQPQNAAGRNTGGLAKISDNGGQGLLDDGVLQLLLAAGTAAFDDAVDNIRAEADLTVAGRALGHQLAGFQIRQHHGNGGGADIDGAANDGGVGGIGNFHALEGIVLNFALDTDGEVMLPQRGCQLDHDGIGHLHFLHAKLSRNRPLKALHIGHGIVQGRLCHGDHHGAEIVGKGNAAFLQLCLAILKNGDLLGRGKVSGLHPALVSGGNVRHQHGAIGDHLAVAAQAPAGIIFFVGDMAGGNGIHFAVQQLHTALAAGAVTGAGGVDGHIGTAGQLQQVITGVTFDLNRAAALDLEGYFHLWKSFRKYLLILNLQQSHDGCAEIENGQSGDRRPDRIGFLVSPAGDPMHR